MGTCDGGDCMTRGGDCERFGALNGDGAGDDGNDGGNDASAAAAAADWMRRSTCELFLLLLPRPRGLLLPLLLLLLLLLLLPLLLPLLLM
jgi:hypothetical protein